MLTPKRTPIARITITAAATEHLRDEIVGGGLRPGEALPESQVGEKLGVSRAPVREALTLLEREGLIQFDRRGTAQVCEFYLEDVEELGLMRMVLEPAAARLAAERHTQGDLTAIEENLQALEKANRLVEVTELDLEFHRLIFLAAGNHRLLRSWECLVSQFSLVMRRFHESLERQVPTTSVRDMTVQSHTKLFQLIRGGSPGEAEALARQHTTTWLTEFTRSGGFAAKAEA